ncbi:hypothetical protein [Thermaurantiacus sp.]
MRATPHWHAVLHGLAVLKHADPAAIARRMQVPLPKVEAVLALAEAHGRVVTVGGRHMLTPLARLALAASYSREHAGLRANPEFRAALARFEEVNRELKALMTQWQTIAVGGEVVPNTHDDPAHDARIIDRLGRFHDRVVPLLDDLSRLVPRLAVYAAALDSALTHAEDGDIAFVADVGIESYHSLWFDLHEELLRLSGTERQE